MSYLYQNFSHKPNIVSNVTGPLTSALVFGTLPIGSEIESATGTIYTKIATGVFAKSTAAISSTIQSALNLKEDKSNKEIANGYAGLDANLELIRKPSGASAEVLAGRGGASPRADGSWAKVAASLGVDFPLQTWADNLVSGVLYQTFLSTAQNGLPTGRWYIEVLRGNADVIGTQQRVIRATSTGDNNTANMVYQSTNVAGTWTPFYEQSIGGGHKGVAYYNGANFTLANSVWTKIPVNTVGLLVQSTQIPIVNGSLVIQKTGHYVLQANIRINYTTLGTLFVGIAINGSVIYTTNLQTNPQQGILARTSTPAFLTAGTTIELFAWSNTGSVIIATGENYIAAFEV